MATLSRDNTDLLWAAVTQTNESGNVHDLCVWMHSTPYINDTDYATIKANFEAWKTAYDNDNLYGTPPSGSPYKVEGISHFPIPPTRNT